MSNLFNTYPVAEKNKIASFIKTVLKKQGFKNVILGMSGGIDSTVSFLLLKEAVKPENIFIAHLPYSNSYFKDIENLLKSADIPQENIFNKSITPLVEAFEKELLPFRHSGNQAKPEHPESDAEQ